MAKSKKSKGKLAFIIMLIGLAVGIFIGRGLEFDDIGDGE